ncbi:peroxisomal biogenesis factor 14 isoform X2 [Oratosquilla oratoria]
MSETMSESDTSEPPAVRQELVETAVKFLINPKVVNSSSEQKESFLRKKGLNDSEVKMALSQASSLISTKVKETSETSHYAATGPSYLHHTYIPPEPSMWIKVRDICNALLLITGASYGLYHLYKNYICKWLTGKKPRTLEDSIVELQQSVVEVLKDVQKTLQSVEQSLNAHNHHIQSIVNDSNKMSNSAQNIIELKSEISSLKGLLLNRKSFPTAPVMLPSIPKWQMTGSGGTSPTAAADTPTTTEEDSKDVNGQQEQV